MKRGTALGIKDFKGKELHIGDYVIHAWSWYPYNGKMLSCYKMHRLTWNREYKRVLLDAHCFNRWDGGGVQKISPKEVRIISALDGDEFFIIDGNPVPIWTFFKPDPDYIDPVILALFTGEPYKKTEQ